MQDSKSMDHGDRFTRIFAKERNDNSLPAVQGITEVDAVVDDDDMAMNNSLPVFLKSPVFLGIFIQRGSSIVGFPMAQVYLGHRRGGCTLIPCPEFTNQFLRCDIGINGFSTSSSILQTFNDPSGSFSRAVS